MMLTLNTSVKQRILDIYKQTWYPNVVNSNRLSLYSLFILNTNLKQKHTFDKYRIILSKIPTFISRFCNRDRTNIIREKRKCIHCIMHVKENEYHFVSFSKVYKFSYPILYTLLLSLAQHLKKMRILCQVNRSIKIIDNVAKYLYHAIKVSANIA